MKSETDKLEEPLSGAPKISSKLPPTVIGLAIVSLLTDASSEAIFPLLPVFLVSLGASAAFIGAVEGTAEFVANILKYLTGLAADRRSRLKPLVLGGYGLSTFMRPLMAFAAAPWHVLIIRVFDRIGKGVRTSPRDALIAAVVEPSIRARAYGFHRAMDHAGAAVGTILAAGMLWLLGASGNLSGADTDKIRTVFLFAAVPGILALVALALTPEPQHPAKEGVLEHKSTALENQQRLPPALRRAMIPITLFSFANATDAFLLVKAAKIGVPAALAPILWLALHIVKASVATAGGRLADKFGKRTALFLGWLVYAITWGAVGFADSFPTLLALTAVYGTSSGLAEGAERGLVADLSGGRARGRAFGFYNMLIGLAALLANIAFGAAWDHWGSIPAFAGSAGFALLAAGTLLVLVPARE